MLYCDESELNKYVLQAYLDKVEELYPGSIAEHLQSVSDEISETILQGGYTFPNFNTSPVLKKHCAVIVCWRSVGEITSLMSTESNKDNIWIPLQNNHNRALEYLTAIRNGELNPFPDLDNGSSIIFSSPDQIFTEELWSKY